MVFKDKDIKYIAAFVAIPIVAALFTFIFYEKIRYNKDLLNFIANIFSILTGFLLLVISTSGEVAAANANGANEEDVYRGKRKFNIRFQRYLFLFFIYLVVLCLIFIYYLLVPQQSNLGSSGGADGGWVFTLLEILICFFSIVAFLCSFFIPLKIKQLFEEKINSKS
ncbi:hypothetical protein ISO42_04805 [Morganella morganii subsp. morganii]|uniref:hypothetical protein n=1 Tax=Morganella morganii TaxID=582 RepID=UPI001BD9927C|nr:hypothetical protein [Morganella morganii]MBT0332120.1 hypothetical protein [Morganella morganii subsp. morganii]MBT0511382.1 hypothetical protein [Morganella morganii subsp. morganii]